MLVLQVGAKLRRVDHTGAVYVNLLKDLTQVRHLILINGLDENVHGGSFKLRHAAEIFKSLECFLRNFLVFYLVDNLEPWVFQRLGSCQSLGRVHHQQLRNKVLALSRDRVELLVLEVEVGLFDLLKHLVRGLALEWQISGHEHVEENSSDQMSALAL